MSERSNVWKYFSKCKSEAKAECLKCNKQINNVGGSTGAMQNHLKNMHNIYCKTNAPKMVEEEEQQSVKKMKHMNRSITDYMQRETMQTVVAKLASIDNISVRTIARSTFIRQAMSDRFPNQIYPKSATDIMNLINKEYEERKKEMINKLLMLKEIGQKFSITLDEWTSLRRRRYLNINIHGKDNLNYNLGLIRIERLFPANDIVLCVEKHLDSFGISFKHDIVGTTHDGAPVMLKYGRECPAESQICTNHTIHLAVCDTFYKKTYEPESKFSSESEDSFAEESDEDIKNDNDEYYIEKDSRIKSNLEMVRKIVNYFRSSPARNSFLQRNVKLLFEKEIELAIDVKTRWSSIEPMLEKFILLEVPISQALTELNAVHLIENINIDLLSNIKSTLAPISAAVEALSRNDSNIFTAQGVINFLENKLNNSDISKDLLKNIKERLKTRENTELKELSRCLIDPSKIPLKSDLTFATSIFQRLYGDAIYDEQSAITEDLKAIPQQNHTSLKDEIQFAIENVFVTTSSRIANIGCSSIKQDFAIFRKTSERTTKLNQLYEALSTIKATSTIAERIFSSSSHFCTKLRSRLSDKHLNSLVFLKCYYLHLK